MDERLGPYRIDRELGRGGMGVVYLAHDERLDRFVAIKALPEEVADDVERLTRFRREARLIAQLNHPHIAQIHHLLEDGGRTFLVLEYIAGRTLAARLKAADLELSDSIRLCAQVARALEAAHHRGVIHRDLKPGNIMVTEDGIAKVLDFGIAVRSVDVEAGPDATTAIGTNAPPDGMLGTPGYMAPEQVRGKTVDSRADLFGFGCVLYECLTGKAAFDGECIADRVAATLREDADIALIPASVGSPVRDLVRRCLAKSIEDRQQSAGDARLVLEEAGGLSTSSTARPTDTAGAPGNIPRERTTFVGRERELEQVEALLGEAALVTVTGSGGCGKTRLAMRVAERVVPPLADGSWLVDLAPVTDPSMVERACAEALGVTEQAGIAVTQSILAHLEGKTLLLIVDNCEHVLAASSCLIDAIIASCPGVKVIATSREALGIDGERSFRVPSLSLPTPDAPTVEALLNSEAVKLFVDRAAQVSPGFSLRASNAESIATICRRLDGIPLALELAAARMRVLSAAQIAQRLDDRFRLLTGGSKTSLPRQQTLRAAIDWSYEQLNEREKTLLRGLSVFMGGWTLESASAVCTDRAVDEFEILDLLTRLIEKSTVIMEHHGEEARYRLLETVRQYAREKLLEAGEGPALRERHLLHFLDFADGVTERLWGPDQERLVEALDEDHDNFRAAIEWAVGETRAEEALRLTCALSNFWSIRSLHGEALEHFEAALAVPGADPSEPRGAVRCRASWCAFVQGKFQCAEAHALAGLKISETFGDRKSLMVAHVTLGAICSDRKQISEALTHFNSALQLARELGNRTGEAACLNNLGEAHIAAGDLEKAKQLCEEALSIIREVGNAHMEGWNLSSQGAIAIDLGDLASAQTFLAEALSLFQRVGNARYSCLVLTRIACLRSAQRHHEEAARLFGASEAMMGRRKLHFEKHDQTFHDRYRQVTREALGAEPFGSLCTSGHRLSEDDAFSMALSGTVVC